MNAIDKIAQGMAENMAEIDRKMKAAQFRRIALEADAPGFDPRIHTVTERDENGTPTEWELAEWIDANGNVTRAQEPEEE